MKQTLLTVAQAAKRLGISRQRVQQLIYAGRLPATRLADMWLIEPKDLTRVRDRKPGRPGWRKETS